MSNFVGKGFSAVTVCRGSHFGARDSRLWNVKAVEGERVQRAREGMKVVRRERAEDKERLRRGRAEMLMAGYGCYEALQRYRRGQ